VSPPPQPLWISLATRETWAIIDGPLFANLNASDPKKREAVRILLVDFFATIYFITVNVSYVRDIWAFILLVKSQIAHTHTNIA
jgi:hypothetical protein